MDWKLELVPIPVSDVDRAKAFNAEKVGFNLDLDHRVGDDFRVVQLTPPRFSLLDGYRNRGRQHAAGLCPGLGAWSSRTSWLLLQAHALTTGGSTLALAASWWSARKMVTGAERVRIGILLLGGVVFVAWAAYWGLLVP